VTFEAAATDLRPSESLTIALPFELGSFEPGEIVIPPSEDDDYIPPSERPTFWDSFGPLILGPAAVVVSLVAGRRRSPTGRAAPGRATSSFRSTRRPTG